MQRFEDATAALTCLFWRAATSRFSSLVANAEHVVLANERSALPKRTVDKSIMSNVVSVCKRSFASACHSAHVKISLVMAVL